MTHRLYRLNRYNRRIAMLAITFATIVVLWLPPGAAQAEPYLAAFEGMKCSQCHSNGTGGGMRTAFGNAYAQTKLAARTVDVDDAWTGFVGKFFAIGGDLRASAKVVDTPNLDQSRVFDLDQARLYVNLNVIPERLSVYLDELIAPGVASNREAFLQYRAAAGTWSIKAGKFYLPYGLRLQDDTALVRQLPGINMFTPDTGIELNWEPGAWSMQAAVTNGGSGGAETDTGKRYSLQSAYVASRWRIGVAANWNDTEGADRRAVGLHATLRTGPIAWLAEYNHVIDEQMGDDLNSRTALLEGNWRLTQGHNLKITTEYLDPNDTIDEDHRTRQSAVYEYTPIQFLQLRGGARIYDGMPQDDSQNRREYFLEVHGFY